MPDLSFQFRKPLAQLHVLGLGSLGSRRQVSIVAPPVQPYLLGLINRADEQTNLQRQQLYVGERDFDVARNHQTFIKNPVEHVHQSGRTRRNQT